MPKMNSNKPSQSHEAREGTQTTRSWLDVVERPLILTPVSILCGLLGLAFYTPVLVLCGTCALLALHHYGLVKGKRIAIQLLAYACFTLVVVCVLWVLHLSLANQSKQAAQDIANRVSQMLAASTQTVKQITPPASDKSFERSQPSKPAVKRVSRESAVIVPPPQPQAAPTQMTMAQPASSPVPRTITFEQFNAAIDRQNADCIAKLEVAPGCAGDDLAKCSDMKLLEWSKTLMEHVKPIYDQFQLDQKVASAYSGTKLVNALDAAKRSAAVDYRRCCANDALRLYKEMAHRVGGGNDNVDFYEWSEQLLAPVDSKTWKLAMSRADDHLLNARYQLDILSTNLELVIKTS
jgi:hypothetical protein